MAGTWMRLAICSAALLLATGAAAGPDPKAESCADCHGKDGVSTHAEVPTIAGVSAFTIEDHMLAFRSGEDRPCRAFEFQGGDHPKGAKDDMCAIAKHLSEADVKDLAAHFAGVRFAPFAQPSDAAEAAVGAKVHKTACEKCHSAGGSDPADDAGILAGQPREYLERSFKDFRAGKRVMDEKMAPKVKALTDAEVEALVEFYAHGGKP